MIIIILGGVGSGKSLSIIKEIMDSRQYALCNFRLKNMKNYHRIQISDIIKEEKVNIGTDEKPKYTIKKQVNWQFWDDIRKTHKRYSIFLDEFHNIGHARRSMSSTNILLSKWISQIRKILSDSETNHIFILSQTISKIDKDFRDLAQVIIKVKKMMCGKHVFICQKYYDGLDRYIMGLRKTKIVFLGNPYFKYYDSQDLITFSDAERFL